MNRQMERVAIIGAGISGLSTAQLLKNRYSVAVFEKEDKPGGLIKCQRVNESLFHTCGGHVFNSKRQDVIDWFWTYFNKEKEFTQTNRNSLIIIGEGCTIPYPIENHVYLLEEKTQKRFINDLIMMAKAKDTEPKNFEEFLKGRFGKTLYELYFQPYNEKVWRRDLKQVPLSWLEGKLPMPSVEEMIFTNINHIEEKDFVHSTFWYEKLGGSQFIANRLAEGLDIRYNAKINHIDCDNGIWVVEGKAFDKVVFCGNIKDMVNIVDCFISDKYKREVEALQFHGTTAVFCEIDRNPYSWIYLPSRNHESHRIICTGNFSKTNNGATIPEGRITATIEFTDKIEKNAILDNLTRIPLNPKYLDHKYNEYTYPIQDSKTRGLIKNIKAELAPKGFFFTGRFADWEYYNMDIAIGAAMDTVNTYF